jgi:hypothetical protein
LAEPQEPVNTVNLAFRGQKVKLDEYPERTKLPRASDIQEKYGVPSRNGDYEPDHDVDFSDLNNINRELIKLRIRMKSVMISRKLNVLQHMRSMCTSKRRSASGFSCLVVLRKLVKQWLRL